MRIYRDMYYTYRQREREKCNIYVYIFRYILYPRKMKHPHIIELEDVFETGTILY